jgi:hypothetical protein
MIDCDDCIPAGSFLSDVAENLIRKTNYVTPIPVQMYIIYRMGRA